MQQQNRFKSRSISALFLIVTLVHILVDLFVSILGNRYEVPIWLQLVISETTIIMPGLIWMLIYNVPFTEGLGFKKIRISTALMAVLLMYLMMPLAVLVNLVSQIFTSNAAVELSTIMLGSNPFVMIFIVGLFGPFCEEFIFRGIIGNGMTRFGSILGSALVSGLFFGLLHLNLNQFCYAFVLGIIFSLVNYASGSIITSIIMHAVINTDNVVMLILVEKLYSFLGIDGEGTLQTATESIYEGGFLYYAIGVFVVLALIFTLAAVPVFAFIAKNEGRELSFEKIKERPQTMDGENTRSWWLNPYSVIATIVCGVIIFFLEKILTILGF